MEKNTKFIVSLIAFLLIIIYFGPLTVLKAIIGLFLIFVGGFIFIKAPARDAKSAPYTPASFTIWSILFGLGIVLLGVYLVFF